jgi:two-component system chemotaxis response regulator CheB
LWELREDFLVRYRCRVGHSYTEAGLVDNKARAVEDALWTALTALEESAALASRVADRARRNGRGSAAELFRARAEHLEQRGATLRNLLDGVPGPVDAI